MGYKSKTIALTSAINYVVQLDIEANSLEEVVIIGYGTAQRKDLTGSFTKVKENAEVAGQYSSVSSLIQGRTSGVHVTSNTGSPGAPVSVRIRGTNSLRGNNEPLYVIDGVIINSAGEDVLNATNDSNERQQTQNGLTGLNPRDIASMQILKDAAATAIYGSRGANGVVLITTKRGKQGKAQFNAYASSTVSKVSNTIDVLDPVTYAQYRNHAALLEGNNIPYKVDGNNVYLLNNGVVESGPLKQVNWQDEIFQLGYASNAGLNASGASETSNYYISGDINEMKGVVPNTFLNSSNFRINYTSHLSDKMKLDSRVSFYLGRGNMSQGASSAGGQRSFMRQLISYNPLVDGELDSDDVEVTSPYAFLSGYEEKINEKRVNASIDFTYKLTDDFKYQLRAGTNYRDKSRSRWYGTETFKGGLVNGNLSLSTLRKITYTIDNLLMYSKKFDNKSRINAVAGVTYDGSDAILTTYNVADFPVKTLKEKGPQYGNLILDPFSSENVKDQIFSYLGRVSYTHNNKYIINGSFRVDNSSKFSEDNQTGYFPSASLAWIVSREKFLRKSRNQSLSNF